MNAPFLPKISILTPSFNQGRYIEQTICSVLDQDYTNFEHIVVDGGSNDGTVAVLKRFPHLVWVSERDRGQADALQKGFDRAGGEIIGWINSDDYYAPATFAAVAEIFRDPRVSWVVGNLAYLYEATTEVVFDRSPQISYEALLRDPDIVKQPPTFFRRDILRATGGWCPDFQMAMDLDLWVRLARIAPPRMENVLWAYFRIHPDQKTSSASVRRQASEIARIMGREGVSRTRIIGFRALKEWYLTKANIKQALIGWGILNPKYRYKSVRSKRTSSA
jgi:glycosyltransferase involved in cell wall biosynthesis